MDDVWEEILIRIPAKELIPCKLVCKSWCKLITDDKYNYFTKRHLHHWKPRSRKIILRGSENQFLLLNLSTEISRPVMFNNIKKHLVPSVDINNRLATSLYFRWLHNDKVLDARDGLLLIKLGVIQCSVRGVSICGFYDLLVFNAITNSYKQLAVCSATKTLSSDRFWSWKIVYDDSSKRYKVFGIDLSRNNPLNVSWLSYELHGSKNNIILPQFRNVTIPVNGKIVPSYYLWKDSIQVVSVKGRVYMLINKMILLSADDLKYKFVGFEPTPSSPRFNSFTSSEGFHFLDRVSNTEFQHWALKDIENNVPTWVKQQSVVIKGCTISKTALIMSIRCVGNMLIMNTKSKLYYYNMVSQEWDVFDSNSRYYSLKVVSDYHVDSLINI